MRVSVESKIRASIEDVWSCWITPSDIMQWNAANDEWHTPSATVDLQVGGKFCSRMEAKDGSMGFDFAGVYTRVDAPHVIETEFGGRTARVEFTQDGDDVLVRQTFDAEDQNPPEMQRQGWQSILDRFALHVTKKVNHL
jgi:uncharacterized protein YndB with AHSA1/START domain